MRTNRLSAFLVAAAVLAPAVASADVADSLVGRYDATFEQVTSNCQSGGMTLDRGPVVVSKRGAGIAVETAKLPALAGPATKVGRLKAASKLGKTPLPLDGKFSIAGTIDDGGKLDAVFVGEFFQDGKPFCTQSWNVTGARVADAAKGAAPTAAPSATFARFALVPPME
jgi:hypothetical protein